MRQSLVTARRAVKNRKPGWIRRPAALAERVEQAHVLDPVVSRLSDGVVRVLPAGTGTDALHGVPFGQPVHPALVRLPLGCWASAVLLDLVSTGMSREDAYSLVQDAAMDTWDTGTPFRTTVRKQAAARGQRIDEQRLDDVCRPERYVERLGDVFERLRRLT